MSETYTLTMTREQALVARDAMELYARVRFGQFDNILVQTLDIFNPKNCERRDIARKHLNQAALEIIPDEYRFDMRLDRAWALYETIRHSIAWHDHPDGGLGASFDSPMLYSADEPMPKCTVEE